MAKTKKPAASPSWSQLLRPAEGSGLASIDPRSTPGVEPDKVAGQKALAEFEAPLSDLQERLFAHGRSGGQRRLLLVVQGMDTSGKGGTMRKIVGLMDPQGVSIKAFKAPTPEEKRRGFLWRIRQALPAAGMVGVFDRSQYEDVLAVRVRKLATPAVVERRYRSINEFEAELVDSGCVVVKVMLHISAEEQRARLAERLENPAKYWKYNPSDLDDRALWDDYQRAYDIALERCNTDAAPWHVVPADRKWYRNLAVAGLLTEYLDGMKLEWPPADFDIKAERARLAATA